ncbi:Glutamate-ammonia-ligase adenylyltransferase [Oceanicola granulosus HTCC2516]|uniref:Glutamate-ammonia-ligase adenylyltransferase n=1 Tax=Oceanicola granulosus (strain ATCC BAA-861 / DSM 15982 / KCTC 12143 / HTCC2516) TaxID=314256 RepID=Q2CDW4_OCEGH|nr:[glutamate--ammonia-ligase] adenylyltransferase [Oceanicola granulosus]EAR50864.1 Glutamate-ammonia-ligase adenylyltransferase [Oceanicola granulosus HTCC2516]
MTFAARLTRSPDPFDTARGAELAGRFADQPPELRDLVAGTAGCSPYLAGLLESEADWIEAAFDDPEAALAAEIAAARGLATDDLAAGLRRAKRRVALLTALADLGGVWPLETVTAALTDLADAATDVCLQRLVAAEIARGKVPGIHEPDATAAGIVALAMGKGGAHELNYSSDIDLICLYDETRFERDDHHEARAAFVKVVRRMCALLSDNKAGGYVFRTDLRLRPDAAVTPVCLAMSAAETYYESVGRTWERAAYIKARAAAGDIAAGERFLETLTPFVFRKHLDFAAIQDAHDMRLKIRDHKRLGGALVLEGHDMKLGRGGIREIEFFTQTRQLIAGGRDSSLRVRGTIDGLAALARAGWIAETTADSLTRHYRAHREVEHRLQMINDAQTHQLPRDEEGFARLAAFMGTDVAALRKGLEERLSAVHELTEDFFAPGAAPEDDDDFGAAITERWTSYPAFRSPRAQDTFNRLKPGLFRQLKEAARPEEALVQFDGFLRGLPAGVQIFSLFEANPQLTGLIADICATSPALAQYLSRNAGVLDAVLGGDFFTEWPGTDALVERLGAEMARASDYETRLDAARRWAKEWHFRTGVHHLRGLISAAEAGAQYASLADASVRGLWPVVVEEFAAKHGPMPGRGAVVLGMGSLGAGRLNAASDLDLIVVYDAAGVESSEGRRPLAARPYYARLTQALVTALSAPMAEGRLYEVDMRLRPSGRQGPVATALAAFRSYHAEEAWTWEHLALTRARPVVGTDALADEVEAIRREVLALRGGSRDVRADVADMRARIASAKPPQGLYDAKIGRGRLQDIELCTQAAALLAGSPERTPEGQLSAGVAAGVLSEAQAEVLARSAEMFWGLQAASRLLTGEPLDLGAVGEGGLRLILRETGMASEAELRQAIEETGAAAGAVVDAVTGAASDA